MYVVVVVFQLWGVEVSTFTQGKGVTLLLMYSWLYGDVRNKEILVVLTNELFNIDFNSFPDMRTSKSEMY